jgi:hypothetical protein
MAGRRPCAAGIWLWSVGTAVSLSGALAGRALALALIDLSLPLAVLVGATAGWVLSSLVLVRRPSASIGASTGWEEAAHSDTAGGDEERSRRTS